MRLTRFTRKKSEPKQEVSAGYMPKPNLNKSTFVLVFAILLAGASFYEGTVFQKNADNNNTAVNNTSPFSNTSGTSGGTHTGSYVRTHLVGTVTAVSATSISVQDQFSGDTDTLTITSSTQINVDGKNASASNIQVGDTVMITKASASSSDATKIDDVQGTTFQFNTEGEPGSADNSPAPGLSTN